MKKAFLVFVVLFLSSSIHSQHSGIGDDHFKQVEREIKIDIDETIFPKVNTNTFMSGKPKSLFLSALVENSYMNGKSKMLKFFYDKKFDKKEEKMIASKKVFSIEGTINKDGIDFVNKNYCNRYNEKSTIMITTLLEVEADAEYKRMLEKIVQSVVEKN